MIGGSEQFHRICVATGEQHAVIGEQGSGMASPRCGHSPKRRRKQFCRRIEYLRRASGFTAGYKHSAVIQQRSGVPRARRTHSRRERSETSAWICRVKHLCGRQWRGRAGAAGYKDATIGQAGRGVIHARGGQRCASSGGLRSRIKDFGNGDDIAGVVASTGDQNATIG